MKRERVNGVGNFALEFLKFRLFGAVQVEEHFCWSGLVFREKLSDVNNWCMSLKTASLPLLCKIYVIKLNRSLFYVRVKVLQRKSAIQLTPLEKIKTDYTIWRWHFFISLVTYSLAINSTSYTIKIEILAWISRTGSDIGSRNCHSYYCSLELLAQPLCEGFTFRSENGKFPDDLYKAI